jgi:hypothetical protein
MLRRSLASHSRGSSLTFGKNLSVSRVYSVLFLIASVASVVTAVRAYRGGTIEVGDDLITAREMKRSERPQRFWIAFVATCAITVGFFAASLYAWTHDDWPH